MPVTITVSQVREALSQGSNGRSATGDGAPSNAMLGRWFHQVMAQLIGADPQTNALAALADAEPNPDAWKRALVERAYATGVGPRLTAHRAALQGEAAAVASYWTAVQEACHWLAELAWSAATTAPPASASAAASTRSPAPTSRPAHDAVRELLVNSFESERPVECELREPGWSDSVRLVGVADALLRFDATQRWCVIEFKLGRTSPEIDLGQACLYHLILSPAGSSAAASPGRTEGSLALIRFLPNRHETVFAASRLLDARRELLALIGHVAEVAPSTGHEGVGSLFQVGRVGLQAIAAVEGRPEKDSRPRHARPAQATESTETAESPATAVTDAHRELGRKLIAAFQEHHVSVTLDSDPIIGPTFLRFPLQLGHGMTVASVERRGQELQVRLGLEAAPFIKVEAGRLVVDVQRPDRQRVLFDAVRSQLPTPDPRLGCSQVPVGVDLAGRLHFADFAKTDNAHMLVAGTTGSGKSEWLRLAVAGLILTNTPDQLRLLIIDPKRNAFHALRDSPYLWRPVVFPDEVPAGRVLKELGDEMDRRYGLLDGADSLAHLASRSDVPLPRIVCVCDEYADLINRSRAERILIEEQVCRLGAKSRAAGIHLILATQQPSRQTIKGALDSNIPARVGLRMQKAMESQMLLNESGAERLLGHGDLLFRDVGPLQRLQAPYIPESARNAIFAGR